jgi:hypothetical protein
MEEDPENGKESSHSAHVNGMKMNEWMNEWMNGVSFQGISEVCSGVINQFKILYCTPAMTVLHVIKLCCDSLEGISGCQQCAYTCL